MQITDTTGLLALADAARSAGVLAIDTEFLSGKTYYARLCLLQVAAGDFSAIIDPFEMTDFGPLVDILLDERIMKVMHAAYQDMELLTRLCGRSPSPVFDTQIAATLAGFPSQIGYARLLEDLLGVRIEKTESYTDWSRRPLTARQVAYALDDAVYLQPVYVKLCERLKPDDRLSWLADDFAALSAPGAYESPPQECFRKIKRASSLNRRQLAVLRAVAAWREHEAQRHDLPRQWIIKDESLIEVARRKPDTADALADVRGIDLRSLGDRGTGLMAAVLKGLSTPDSELPLMERRLQAAMDVDGVVKLMGALVRLRGASHGIAPSLLASQTDLDQLASGEEEDSPLLKGWRKALIGDDLKRLLDGKLSLRVNNGVVVAESAE